MVIGYSCLIASVLVVIDIHQDRFSIFLPRACISGGTASYKIELNTLKLVM